MKRISPENLERIRRLVGGNYWTRLFVSAEEQIQLLQEIGLSNEPAIIPEIACLLVDTHGPVWRAAAEAEHRLLDRLSPIELAGLDYYMRQVGSYDRESYNRWRDLKPTRVRRFAETDFAASVCGLGSFHSNGFVREAAVNELLKIWDGHELAFLLIRINDWVPVVREIALNAVRERLIPDYAVFFMQNLRLVLRLENRSRSDKGIVEAICSLLRRPECRAALSAGMASQDRTLRRASFQLAANAEEPGRSFIIRAAVTDPDPIARAWAVRRFLAEISDTELKEISAVLLKDRFMPVRRDTLWALASRIAESAQEPLRAALLDPTAGVREAARHFLGNSGFDIRSYYGAVILAANTKVLSIAIRGLGEVGQKEDTRQIRPFLSDAKSQVRKAAVYALGKLDPEAFLSDLKSALADTEPGVSREAVRACLPKARLLELEALWALFQNDSRLFVRKNVLMLLQRFGKWERLAPLLRACCDANPIVAEMAKSGVLKWIWKYNSSFAEPTSDQLRQIKQALAVCKGVLDETLLKDISSCISVYVA